MNKLEESITVECDNNQLWLVNFLQLHNITSIVEVSTSIVVSLAHKKT